jgi:hypothetical protein
MFFPASAGMMDPAKGVNRLSDENKNKARNVKQTAVRRFMKTDLEDAA